MIVPNDSKFCTFSISTQSSDWDSPILTQKVTLSSPSSGIKVQFKGITSQLSRKPVGDTLGMPVGKAEDVSVGTELGKGVGASEGNNVGASEGHSPQKPLPSNAF